MRRHLIRSLAAAVLFAAPSVVTADEFRFEALTLPAPLTVDGKVDTIIEASGVEPIGDGRRALVAHDKAAPLHVVDLSTGAVVGAPLTSPKFPATNKTGPKWEGMARDSDGNFYLIGAHNGKTDEERATKSVLVRFRLKDSETPAIDDASVVRFAISRALPAALKAAGVPDAGVAKRKIEGLTIREHNGRRELAIGLREPGDKVRAFVADVTNARPDAELELKPLFAFEAEPREGVQSQLTSLEYAPSLGGFLVVTASEDKDNAFHGNTLYLVADGQTEQARKLATFEVAMKCEGLAVLDTQTAGAETNVKLLLTFDNDPHATKIPSRFQTARLTRSR